MVCVVKDQEEERQDVRARTHTLVSDGKSKVRAIEAPVRGGGGRRLKRKRRNTCVRAEGANKERTERGRHTRQLHSHVARIQQSG